MATLADLDGRFDFHPATTATLQQAHAGIRSACRRLADYLNDELPESREKALALTQLEQAMFWSNAAIARNPHA